MDGWYVQVKGYEGDDGRSILPSGRGYRQHPQLGEQISAGRHGKKKTSVVKYLQPVGSQSSGP